MINVSCLSDPQRNSPEVATVSRIFYVFPETSIAYTYVYICIDVYIIHIYVTSSVSIETIAYSSVLYTLLLHINTILAGGAIEFCSVKIQHNAFPQSYQWTLGSFQSSILRDNSQL